YPGQCGKHDGARNSAVLQPARLVVSSYNRRECIPIDGENGRNSADCERHHSKDPKDETAHEEAPPGAFESARQAPEKGVAHLETLELRLGKRISNSQAQHDQSPPEHGINGIVPS